MTAERRGEAAAIRAAAAGLGLVVSDDDLERLLRFSNALTLWNRRLRLTAEHDPVRIIEQHFADSLAVVGLLPAHGPAVDIGSGQGFPGIILGCMRPDLELVLIESRRRRANFLRDAVRRIPLARTRVLEERAEFVGAPLAGRALFVVARALRLDRFLDLARPLLAPDGRAVAMRSEGGLRDAAAIAAGAGFAVSEERLYALPDGSSRALVVFAAKV